MNRWHEAGCLEPDVEVLPDKTICCRVCLATPHATELAHEKATTNSIPQVPPNKPLGQLGLWWPRSVPYSVSIPSVSDDPSSGKNDAGSGQTLEATVNTGPYSSTLTSNEFRLICIEAAGSPEYPLRVNLEVYDLDDCPEYEAVSYTWAGEDGDNKLCKPIYVGPFWDCLLQTKNCWEMLRFVRPRRGIRMVWVDAICINQTNIPERSSQVANMDRIYSSCSRVIVYLGPDMAVPLHERHARRGKLHELETGAIEPVFPAEAQQPRPYRLKHLLSRRYFSRIWVVQELLLSQRAVMRIGDVDFWADGAMTGHFSRVPNWNWGRMPAPWVRNISQGASSAKDLKQLLWMTSRSLATDPRDRVFGLLGIMPELSVLTESPASGSSTSPRQLGGFVADYSLSHHHVFTGLFGYCLLNLLQANILYHASCLWREYHYPSWAPKWTSPAAWRLLFQAPKASIDQVLSRLKELLSDKVRDPFQLHELVGAAHPYVQAERRWYQNASIDTATGALCINLTYYMPLSKPPKRIGDANGFSVFVLEAEPFGVYLLSDHKLDQVVTGKEQLFILDTDDDATIYLVLRPTGALHTFRLVGVCSFVVIQAPWTPVLGIPLKDLQSNLYDVFSAVESGLDFELRPPSQLEAICSGPISYRDILPTLVEFHGKEERGTSALASALYNACVEFIDPRFSPRIGEEGHVEITISSLWKEFSVYVTRRSRLSILGLDSTYNYRILGDKEWRDARVSSSTYRSLTQDGERWVEVRFLLSGDLRSLWDEANSSFNGLFKAFSQLSQVARLTGEDLASMLKRGPKHEDRFVGCANPERIALFGFSDLWDKLQLSGSTFMARIM
ncbi:hypothetical protein ACHAPT_008731 [Fusarium lateritium]